MKKVALINDLSGFGRCSLTAAIPAISALGVQAVPLPTAILSAQTGFGDYAITDMTKEMDTFSSMWKHMGASFDGIYSGFLADLKQIHQVERFLSLFHHEGNRYLADPILGDLGKRFSIFPDDFLCGMRELTRHADVITPNLTELCLLADVSYETVTAASSKEELLDRITEAAGLVREKAYRAQTVVVTGILWEQEKGSTIGNLSVSPAAHAYVESAYTGQSYSGTGDLFASVLIGCLLRGFPVSDAMRHATHFLEAAIGEASQKKTPRNEGVPFENHLKLLTDLI